MTEKLVGRDPQGQSRLWILDLVLGGSSLALGIFAAKLFERTPLSDAISSALRDRFSLDEPKLLIALFVFLFTTAIAMCLAFWLTHYGGKRRISGENE